MGKYPDGITCMDDYLGAIVRFKNRERTRDAWPPGTMFIVAGHWRGGLNLAERDGTLGGEGEIAMRQVPQSEVDILAWRLA